MEHYINGRTEIIKIAFMRIDPRPQIVKNRERKFVNPVLCYKKLARSKSSQGQLRFVNTQINQNKALDMHIRPTILIMRSTA